MNNRTTVAAPEMTTVSGSGPFGLNRMNLILLALLLLQIIAIAFFYWPNSKGGEGSLPLLGELSTSDIKAIAITDGDGDLLNLTRSSDGWSLTNAGGYPATSTKVDEILGKLMAIKSNRLVTNTAGSHKRLKVADDDFNTKIELTTSDGVQTLFVGTAPNSGATHVRLTGQDETYLTGEIASWELGTQISSWTDTLYFEIPRDEVVSLTLENANGTVEFTREDAESPWIMADLADDEVLDSAAVGTLLGRVVNVRMVEPLGKAAEDDYGMDTPQATVTIKTKNTKDTEDPEATYTIQIGAKNEETENYVLKSSESDFFVTVAAFTGDELTGKARDDFLQVPEPTPEAEGSEESTGGTGEESDGG